MKRLLLILFACAALRSYAQDTTEIKKVVYPAGYAAKIDEVYADINGWKGREDIYFNPTAAKPTAVIFNIHGGGWNHGTKEAQGGFNTFFKAGMAVVNIEYRLTSQATAPAAVEDVRAAILYVVKHAKELNIDPQKLVIMGGSAGGHLALLSGLLQHDTRFDGAYKNVKDFTIAAIIDKYGPADLSAADYAKSRSLLNWLGTNAADTKFRESVSPSFYVTKNSPPVFIVHGDADPTVPYQQSVELHKKLTGAGVKTQFITVEGGVHGQFTKEKNAEINKAIIAFLKEAGVLAA